MRPLALALAAALLSSCNYIGISFSKPLDSRAEALQQEIHSFYNEIQEAYATGNAEALSGLFSPSITHPLTREQIRDWAHQFFARNNRARFHILSFSIDKLSYVQPVVTLKYKVETPSGTDDFGATETDNLAQINGRWYIGAWDRQTP